MIPPEIASYITQFPLSTQNILQQLRNTILLWVPDASEKMAYGLPTLVLHGNLVHYGAWAKHIGFYPGASGIAHFSHEFQNYSYSKGAVQFPLDEELPWALLERIVRFRVQENLAKKAASKSRKRA